MTHRQTHHGVAKGRLGSEGDEAYGGVNEPRTYKMVFLPREEPRPCPVKGCSGRSSMRTAVRVHFWHLHVRDTVVILEEEHIHHPWRPLCDMLVPWKALNETHRRTTQCTQEAKRRRRRLAV